MDKIIEIEAIRKEKVNQFMIDTSKRIEQFHNEVERNVNIREKVKAKHLFSEKVERERSTPFTEVEEHLFLDWFMYDYVTIRGTTIYQEYLAKSMTSNVHPLSTVIDALFLASVLEPFKVIKSDHNHIYAMKILTGEKVKLMIASTCILKHDEIVSVRTIPVFDHYVCISNVFIQNGKSVAALRVDLQSSQESWRTFLKKNAIKYMWRNHTKR